MVTHMKTTVELADPLLAEAKRVARKERTTLRALLEQGLRRVLDERRATGKPFRLKDCSVPGTGLHPDAGDGSWERIRDMIYEGHGA
jgi:hypothetical protein